MAVEYAPPTPRPAMRGAMHRAAVPVAVVLTIVLAVRAESGGDLVAVLVYGVCVTAMLTVSGIYHSARLAARERRLLRRLDHAMILVGIAGTYTAVIVLALDGTTQAVLLAIAWGIAIVGMAIRMLWLDAPSGLVAAGVPGRWMADDARLPRLRRCPERRRDRPAGGRRRPVHRRGDRLRAQASEPVATRCSATTRCSTRSSSSPPSATGSPSSC